MANLLDPRELELLFNHGILNEDLPFTHICRMLRSLHMGNFIKQASYDFIYDAVLIPENTFDPFAIAYIQFIILDYYGERTQ